ncbi:MAG: hypothetical protein AAFR36_28235 [Bacteroidota bacterium]
MKMKYQMLKQLGLILMLLLVQLASGFGQSNSGRVILLNFGYGPQVPLGDMADRFGNNFAAEVSADYMTESNWTFGVQGQFLFGSTVNEDVLAGLRTETGDIIGNDRDPADIQLRMRGSYYGVRVGRLFGLFESNRRSGIRINLGAGLLQHRIRIQDDPFRVVPQLEGEYAKGYDRLTNGLALHQFIGYQTIGKSNGINLTIGFEFFEGFTQNRRSFNFDTRMADTEQRLDLLAGLRVSVSLPFYQGNAEDIFY